MADSNKVLVEIGAEDTASDKIDRVGKKIEEFGGKSFANFGKAVDASKAFTLAVVGMGAAAGAGLLVAIHAAAGAQEEMAKFSATMATTGKGSKEASDAILKAADAATKLGFDDEESANVMARFYQNTHSTTEALKLNGIAMDLARSKHIDLSTAGTLVNQVLAGNGKVLKQYGIDIKDSATPLEALGLLHDKVAGQAVGFTQTMNGQLEILKVGFGNFLEEVGTPFLAGITSILQAVNGWIDSMGGVKGVLTEIEGVLAVLQPYFPIIAGMIIGAMVPAFIAWGISLWGVVAAAAAGLVALAPYIIIGGAIAAVAYLIYDAWTGNWFGVRDNILAVVAVIMPYLQQFIDFVKLLFQDMGSAVDLFVFAWQTNMFGIQTIAMFVWDGIKLYFTAVWEMIKGIFKIAQGILTLNWQTTWDGIKLFAKGVWDYLTLGVQLMWNALGIIWDAGSKLLSTGWTNMLNGIANLATSIWEGIKNTFKAGINAIIAFVNSFIGTYNSAVSKVPGGKNLQLPTFTPLADGGIVNQPTFALIGEAGPEAVVPLGRRGGAGGLGNSISITIEGNHFYGDDETFAKKIGDQIMDMLNPHLSFTTS